MVYDTLLRRRGAADVEPVRHVGQSRTHTAASLGTVRDMTRSGGPLA